MKITNYANFEQELDAEYRPEKLKKFKYRAIFTIGSYGGKYSSHKEIFFCDEKFDFDQTTRNNHRIEKVNFYLNK